jgi:hypothetical protein
MEAVDPPAGGVAGFEENETWIPLGKDEAVNDTGELKDPNDVIVTVFVAELPPPIVIAEELNPNEKSDVTVSVKTACTKSPTLGAHPSLPEQAVTSMTYWPGATCPTVKLPVKFPRVLPPPLTAQPAPVITAPFVGLEREQL